MAGPIERAVDALDRALEDEQLTDETAALARRTRDRFADEG